MSGISSVEKMFLNKLNKLYHKARDVKPLLENAGEILSEAETYRKGYEQSAVPMITAIGNDNIGCFSDLLPDDIEEEVLVGKSRAIGLLRTKKEDEKLYAVSVAVYSPEETASGDGMILRIKWLYVHPLFRNNGIGNAMFGELINIIIKGGFRGATIDLPDNDSYSLIKELAEKWQFNFEKGLEPDFILRLSDIPDTKSLFQMPCDAKPLCSVGQITARNMIKNVFKTDRYNGFLKKADGAYIDPELSCFIEKRGSASALALVHITPGGTLLVEYIYLASEDKTMIMDLIIRIVLSAFEKFGRNTILRMETESFETALLLDKMFPKQQTIHLTEGILMY